MKVIRARRISHRRAAACSLALVTLVALGGAASAAANPVWNLGLHHNQTHFPPGGSGQLWFDIHNVGHSGSSGETTLTIELPSGLSRQSVTAGGDPDSGVTWSCPGLPNSTTITCTTEDEIARNTSVQDLIVNVNVSPAANGLLTAEATLSGGGAIEQAIEPEPIRISSTPASFGVVEGSFEADFFEADGLTPERRAGSHPDAAVFSFDLNSVNAPTESKPKQKEAADSLRNLKIDLPDGFVGNLTAVEECLPAQLAGLTCPRGSQIGRVDATTYPRTGGPIKFDIATGLYNLSAPRGSVAALGFIVQGNPVQIRASLDPTNNYTVRTRVVDLTESLPPFHNRVTVWGVPADPSHDDQRCGGTFLTTEVLCPSDLEPEPFLTTPFDCEADHEMVLSNYDSWQNTGVFGPDITYELPGPFTGCENVPFDGEVNLTPTNPKADAPTGLEVEVTVPQNDDPEGIATSPLKDAVVTLPEGMATNPAAADGLGACTESQVALGTDQKVRCPRNAKIGTALLETPVLPDPVKGSVYLATQHSNPFNSLLAMYLVLEDKERGLLVKLPGEITADQQTGQLTTHFANNPQLPFSSLKLTLKGGKRAPLVNPPTCGTKTLTSRLAPWANPGEAVSGTSAYEITQNSDGSPCPATEADRPFAPTLSAGTIGAQAGSHSPFVLRLTRPEGNQTLNTLNLQMPPGLTAKLAGVSQCPDATLAAISKQAGTGAGELASPSCPANAQVGVATVGAGSGHPVYVSTGKAYLAGPYKGAPLSLAVVMPALAGPFDLGTEVVRNKLIVDPRTAEITVQSDPFPRILHGIPLRLRDVRVRVNRQNFMLTGTNCDPLAISAAITGSGGASARRSNRFQLAGCGNLGFNPKLNLSFGKAKKATKRNAHPPLHANLNFNEGDANISSVEVALPKGVLLDQARLGRICSRANYAAETCPAESRVGYAKATTPLLANPVEGPVYLKSSNNPLPDLAADLNGQIDIDLFGMIDQKENKKGLAQIRNTFDVVPDVPVSDFELTLEGGEEGLLVNSTNICKRRKTQRLSIRMSAHNGHSLKERSLIGSACKKINKKKAKRLKRKAKKLAKKAKRTKTKARKANGKKRANKLQRKAKKLKKKSKKLRRQARKLGR